MKDTYYVLAKVVWCGECDDFAIEEILRFKYNVAFASKEIYHYINLNYIRDDWDKSIKEYREGNRLYYYVDDINFRNLMSTFLVCMDSAFRDGGLYCGNIVSKDKSDYNKKEQI
jgi:hypothetical protein